MAGNKISTKPNANIDFWEWANDPDAGPLQEWEATPDQLGWIKDDDFDGRPNWDYDKPMKKPAVSNKYKPPPHIKDPKIESDFSPDSLGINPGELYEYHTFRAFALDKIKDVHPGNCDGDLLSKMYDAIQRMENWLYREDWLDDHGRLVHENGGHFKDYKEECQFMQAWFEDAMLSIERVVGLHKGTEYIEEPSDKKKRTGEVALMVETFRLGPYTVLKQRPAAVEEKNFVAIRKEQAEEYWRRREAQKRQEAEEVAAIMISFCRDAVVHEAE